MGFAGKHIQQLLSEEMGDNHLTGTFFWVLQGYLAGSAGRVVFCCRQESLYSWRQSQPFCSLHFSRLLLSITDNVEKILKSMWHGLCLKNPENEPWESQVRIRWWSCLQSTLCVLAFLAASLCGRQPPSLCWGSPCEDLGCLSCFFPGLVLLFWLWLVFQITLKWSKQYLVAVCQHLREKYARLTNLFSLWILKWVYAYLDRREGKTQVFLCSDCNLMSSPTDVKPFSLPECSFIAKEASQNVKTKKKVKSRW